MTLTLKNISKSYGANRALKGFSATLEPGIYALLGPNGSGKSTLMNILTGNLNADSGEIICTSDSGVSENVLKMGVRFREKLGFMPQYPGLYKNFTVERFMWYMAALKGLSKEKARRDIPEILRAVELDDIPRQKIGALSGGMKQRLTLAQAVLGDPELLILDEPTAGLDPKQRISIRNFISGIALNRIVLIATHVVPDIEFIARDAIFLKKGEIVDFAPPRELTERLVGKVWNVSCAEPDVSELQKNCRVTGIVQDGTAGKLLVRVLSDKKPTESSFQTAPTLEDYYLSVFDGETSHG